MRKEILLCCWDCSNGGWWWMGLVMMRLDCVNKHWVNGYAYGDNLSHRLWKSKKGIVTGLARHVTMWKLAIFPLAGILQTGILWPGHSSVLRIPLSESCRSHACSLVLNEKGTFWQRDCFMSMTCPRETVRKTSLNHCDPHIGQKRGLPLRFETMKI